MAKMKKHLQRWLPAQNELPNNAAFRGIKTYLLQPTLWHFNRQSVAKGVSLGLLVAFIPLPFQMIIAALMAIVFRANLPLALAMTWVTNPFTFLPINFFIYEVGKWILQTPNHPLNIHFFDITWNFTDWDKNFEAVMLWVKNVGKPYLIGLPIVSVGSALLSYFLVNIVWRISIISQWKKRKKHRKIN